ncbi:MAG: saccharopine dehydrogenase family protein [Gemmatimonadaceae bacterium]
MRFLVLGSGLQGSACAYDLLHDSDVEEVRLADVRVPEPPLFLAPHVGKRLSYLQLDVSDRAATLAVMRGVQGVLSAAPYYFNADLAALAVEAGVHFADLGGNTEIVTEQKKLHNAALAKGVSVIPDCGLAPGMVNILAQYGIDQLDRVDRVKIYVGGLPQEPRPPINYQVVYSLEGMLDYYTTPSWVLRDGRRAQVAALSEIERVDFPAPLGELEAFHTAGGLSTMAFRYEGEIPTMEYKTLRYPGHAQIMAAIRDLGLLDREPIAVNGARVVPRDVAVAVLRQRLTDPQGKDVVALRVVVSGVRGGKAAQRTFELVDRYDEENHISAMMRTTGYSLAITGLMQVRGEVRGAGVLTPDEAIPAERYVGELRKRGIAVRVSDRSA